MSDETKKVELKLHPLIERLVEDPAAPPDVTELVGYLGKSTRAGHVRVYASLDLNEYTDVPEAAVRHAEEVPETELEHGGTRLWLDAKAEVVHEVRSTLRVEARFLEGAIAQAHLLKEAEPVPAASEEEGGEEEAFGAPETMLQPVCTLRCPITIQRTCPQTQCPASCRPMLTCNPTCPRTNCGATCPRTRCGPTCVTCPRTCLRTACGATCLGRTCPLPACLPRTVPPVCYPREPREPFGTPVTQPTACPTRCGATCPLTCPPTRCARTCATCLVTRCAVTCAISCRQTVCGPTCARTCQATCLITRCQPTCMVSCGRTCFRTCLCPVRTLACPIERTVACPVERTMACHGPEVPEIPEVGPFGAGYGGWDGGYYGDEGGYGYDPGDYDPYGGPWYGDDESWET